MDGRNSIMAGKRKTAVKSITPHVHYILDESNDVYRIWCSWEASDSFSTWSRDSFPLFFVEQMMHIFVEGYPEADNGESICDKCKSGA